MKITLLTFLLFASFASTAVEPPKGSPIGPYYRCMIINIATFAPKAEKADDAIDASRPSCETQHTEMLAKAIVDSLEKGQTTYQAQNMADAVSGLVDERFHPDFVRAYLDAH